MIAASSVCGRNTTEIGPGMERLIPSSVVFVGSEKVSTKLEVVVGLAMSGEKPLRMAR